MKLKKLMATCVILGYATATHAQSAGSFVATMGWLRLMPQDSSKPLVINNYKGNPGELVVTGSGAGINNVDTLGLTGSYFMTDKLATELVLGFPPRFNINGQGELSKYGKLGDARQWSPALLLKYYFFDAQARFRPYLGLGVSRVWFKDARITSSGFRSKLGKEAVKVSVASRWAAVLNGGFIYNINQHWFAGLSLSYMPVRTEAKLSNVYYKNGEGPRVPVTARTSITINPVVTYLNLGRRF